MHQQKKEANKREQELMMRVLFDSMQGANSAEAEEERLLQQAIEMSK